MNKKATLLTLLVIFLLGASAITAQESGTTVGGHAAFIVYDHPVGKHNGEKSGNTNGFMFRRLYLYFYKEITEKLSIDIQPEWSASTSATPSFGNDIAKKKDPDDVEWGLHGVVKAVVTAALPADYELSFGIVKPLFSWDYGHELFWEEQFNGSKWSCNNYLGAIHDAGFELYKNFELGSMSLPTYIYLLNGTTQWGDNNKKPGFMGTVEPEVGAFKFKFSFYTGKWNSAFDEDDKWGDTEDKNFSKYLVGLLYEKGPFALRGEYAASNWKKKLNEDKDQKANGYYTKVFYQLSSWCRAMFHYDYVNNKFSGSYSSYEKMKTISPGLIFTMASGANMLVTYNIADWKREREGVKDTIKFNRLTAGMRVTF